MEHNSLTALSDALAAAVERAARSLIVLNADSRSPVSALLWRPGVAVASEHALRRHESLDGARVAGRDPGTDVAVLHVEGGAPAIELAREPLQPGHIVLAVARSAETGPAASMGVVSSAAGAWRTWRGGRIDHYIRLDIGLYRGSGGAALVDTQGRALGLATGVFSRGLPLAIPASTVDRVVDEILAGGRVRRGYLGVGLQQVGLPEHLTKRLDLTQDSGAMVLSVEPGGPAEQGGVLLGDILVKVGETPVADTGDVQGALDSNSVGKALRIEVVRGGALLGLEVTVGERPRRD